MYDNKIKFILLFILIFAGQSFNILHAQAQPETSVRQKQKFNSDWKFQLADQKEFSKSEFDDKNWRSLTLPHDWSIEGEFDNSTGGTNGYFPCGIGWYRKLFTIPASMKDKDLVIQFDGVYMNSDVWINGTFLGHYPYGYSTFQYDLTEFLKTGEGAVNVIAVRVDHSLQPSTRWYNGSGIYRNVWLLATNYTHFHNYKGVYITTPEVSSEKALVNVNYEMSVNFFSLEDKAEWQKNIWNQHTTTKTCILRSTVFDIKGIEIAKTETTRELTSFDNSYKFSQQVNVDNPQLWSADSPDMYYLKSEIVCNGKVIDDQVTPFGIRKLEYISGKGMFVNNKPEKLKGVCVHHDGGSFGAAVPIELWHYRLLKLKAMGCNAIRPSHCPFDPEFYNLCDTMGFYILDEAFDEWTRGFPWNFTENNRGKAGYGYHLYFNQWHETDLKAMIWRDRNHPSVVMYSIGNEIPDQMNPHGADLAKELVDICHAEDPTRPVTSACDKFSMANQNGFMDALDISGYNYVDRDHQDKMYQPEYAKRPEKLCLGTETYYTTRNFLGYRDFDYAIGEFLWVGFDYLGESGKYPRRGWDAGIIDIAGNERPEYYLRKSYWSNEPVVRIAIHKKDKPETEWYPRLCESSWNWTANDSLPVYVYTNCDEVELVLNNKSLGKKKVDRNLYYALWNLKYKSGTIKAIGYQNHKKVSEHILKTSGNPAQISVNALKTTLKADGEDLALLEVSILDDKGILVQNNDQEITVEVSGEAKLAGIDSGDLYYTGLFKTDMRKTDHGKLLVAVKSTSLAGNASIELKAKGLKTENIVLHSAK
ncbi:MAG TPA: glycoside hydrolase family 2 TIM barrel-domain containing protein [Prolixibacteraceae bacterium]|nr:glycoside hydrolase family 2 TIM barrel-domain containing protein [Prolixibacteraceae bacterium]